MMQRDPLEELARMIRDNDPFKKPKPRFFDQSVRVRRTILIVIAVPIFTWAILFEIGTGIASIWRNIRYELHLEAEAFRNFWRE